MGKEDSEEKYKEMVSWCESFQTYSYLSCPYPNCSFLPTASHDFIKHLNCFHIKFNCYTCNICGFSDIRPRRSHSCEEKQILHHNDNSVIFCLKKFFFCQFHF